MSGQSKESDRKVTARKVTRAVLVTGSEEPNVTHGSFKKRKSKGQRAKASPARASDASDVSSSLTCLRDSRGLETPPKSESVEQWTKPTEKAAVDESFSSLSWTLYY